MSAKRLAELAVLTAVSLIIFIIELQIPNPFPIPGIKLGLANIITVYAVYHYKPYEAVMIVAVRLLLGSVFSGNISALIYSASVACQRIRRTAAQYGSTLGGNAAAANGRLDCILSVFSRFRLSGGCIHGSLRAADYSASEKYSLEEITYCSFHPRIDG